MPVINKWSLDSKSTSSGLLSHREGHGKLSSFVAGVMLNLVSRGRQKDHGSSRGFAAAGMSLFFLLLFCVRQGMVEGRSDGTHCSISVNESVIH